MGCLKGEKQMVVTLLEGGPQFHPAPERFDDHSGELEERRLRAALLTCDPDPVGEYSEY